MIKETFKMEKKERKNKRMNHELTNTYRPIYLREKNKRQIINS